MYSVTLSIIDFSARRIVSSHSRLSIKRVLSVSIPSNNKNRWMGLFFSSKTIIFTSLARLSFCFIWGDCPSEKVIWTSLALWIRNNPTPSTMLNSESKPSVNLGAPAKIIEKSAAQPGRLRQRRNRSPPNVTFGRKRIPYLL